jgi:alkylhydroperoxidase family enzyme
MPRLRQVPRAEASPEALASYTRLFGDRDPVSQPGTATGTPGNWWSVMALVPDILTYFQAGGALFRNERRVLPAYFRELGVLRAGFLRGSQFVFSQHCKGARAAGVPEDKIAALPSWSGADAFDARERALLAYVDEYVLADGRVQDATFARMQSHFPDEAILELTYITGLYQMYASFSRALRLEYDDVPERVVEIPVPGGGDGVTDIMAAMSDKPAAK